MRMFDMKDASSFAYSVHSNRLKFGILLALQISAFFCSLWIFYRFLKYRQTHKKIELHLIFILLMNSFLFNTLALPLIQMYLYLSYIVPAVEIFCSFWNWFHYSLNIINLFLMAFLTIERHILIFHCKYLQSFQQKLFFHWFPIVFCLFYPPIFYAVVIFFYFCKNQYDFTQLLCTWPCYFGNPYLARFDLFFNNYTPLLIIPSFCVILYIRVFWQRRSMRREAIKWRRDRRLIIQLWLISSLYLGMWMPLQICGAINTYLDPDFLIQAQIDYMYLFPSLLHLVYPFIVLLIIHPILMRRGGGGILSRPILIHPLR